VWFGLALAVLVLQGCAQSGENASQGGGKKGKKGNDGPVPVEVANVVRKDVPIDLTAVGNVEAYSTVSIRSQINGQLEKVFVEDGQYVTKDQKLFQIDAKTGVLTFNSTPAENHTYQVKVAAFDGPPTNPASLSDGAMAPVLRAFK